MKHCTKCGEEKPFDDFGRRAASKDGKHAWCKGCLRVWSAAWHQQNKVRRIGSSTRRSRTTAWASTLASHCRATARKKGLDFDLDAEFVRALHVKQSGRCYWLDVELKPSAEKRNPLQPSIDRLDPSRGYTRDNVVLTSQFANMGRSEMSADKFREFVASLQAHFMSGVVVA